MTSKAQLTPVQRATLCDLLQARRDAFERQRQVRLQGLPEVEQARQTRQQDADDATQTAGRHELEATVEDLDLADFELIDSALRRIHGKDYGVCVDCHAAIPFERLRVEPQALRCVACQILHERARAA
jgi:RNA polymerase-binding transcription factor DksA